MKTVPGPLRAAIASAANENRNLTHRPKSDTFTGNKTDSQEETANCRSKRDVEYGKRRMTCKTW